MNKQIEMMAHDMCEYFYEGTCYQDKKPCDCKCEVFTDAQYLYGKGYRKTSDVAMEIFEEINALYKRFLYDHTYTNNELEYDLAELKKKYESEGADDE